MHDPTTYRVTSRPSASRKGRTVWVVVRQDGSEVNDHEHPTQEQAERQLAILRALCGSIYWR